MGQDSASQPASNQHLLAPAMMQRMMAGPCDQCPNCAAITAESVALYCILPSSSRWRPMKLPSPFPSWQRRREKRGLTRNTHAPRRSLPFHPASAPRGFVLLRGRVRRLPGLVRAPSPRRRRRRVSSVARRASLPKGSTQAKRGRRRFAREAQRLVASPNGPTAELHSLPRSRLGLEARGSVGGESLVRRGVVC